MEFMSSGFKAQYDPSLTLASNNHADGIIGKGKHAGNLGTGERGPGEIKFRGIFFFKKIIGFVETT
jgi:hypothetical protein